MLNLDELEEEGGLKRKTTKERLKEERALEAQRKKEEIQYNLRKDRMEEQLKYEVTSRALVKDMFDKLGYKVKWPLVQADSRHQRGCFELLVELSDRRIRLLEDAIKARDLRSELLKTIHVEVIDKVLKKHESNINILTGDFMERRDKMMANRKSFLQSALCKGKQLRDEIRVASYASDKAEEVQKLIQRYESELAMYNEMCERRFEQFYSDYEKAILDKWIIFKNVYEDYKRQSGELRQKIYIEEDKDKSENAEILHLKKMRMKFEAELAATSKVLDPAMQRDVEELGKKVELLESDLRTLQDIQSTLIRKDKESYDHLNRVTDRVLKELKGMKKLGEKVVRLRRSCNSLETEAEQAQGSDLKTEELEALSCGFPSADLMEFKTAKVQAQSRFMSGRLREMKDEHEYLKNRVREAIAMIATLEDRFTVAGKLDSLK